MIITMSCVFTEDELFALSFSQEIGGLREAMGKFKLTKVLIVTLSQDGRREINNKPIEIKSLINWSETLNPATE